ncbi:MAG: SUMF1/EgtB/PvdO family nonheme iron enzyme [Saprospiraceae bacterium]
MNTSHHPEPAFRYTGVSPFTVAEHAQFFGRGLETEALHRLVIHHSVLVLFGRSSVGKTSLLQAGLSPALSEKGFLPVRLHVGDATRPISRQLWEHLMKNGCLPFGTPDNLSLPEYVRLFDAMSERAPVTPILLFDQFEDVFTRHNAQSGRRDLLLEELAAFSRQIQPNSPDENPGRRMRVVFSIRSEYRSLLEAWMPAGLSAHFELLPLDAANTRTAIAAPTALSGHFASRPFSYSPDALDTLAASLKSTPGGGETDAGLLQYICMQIERRLASEHTPAGFEVGPDFFGGRLGVESLRADFLADSLRRADPVVRRAALLMDFRRLPRVAAICLLALAPALFVGWRLIQVTRHAEVVENQKRTAEAARDLAAQKNQEAAAALQRTADSLRMIQEEAEQAKLALARVQNEKAQSEIRRKTAKSEMEKAQTDAFLTQMALSQMEQEKKAADAQRRDAEDRLQVSRQAAEESEKQKIQAERAREAREQQNAEVVLRILQNADRDILNLRYNDALEKVQAAARLGAQAQEVVRSYLELAFWYGETGNLSRAAELMDSIAGMSGNAAVSVRIQSLPAAAVRNSLREAMKLADAAHFDFLYTQKYYPDLVAVSGGQYLMGCDSDCADEEAPHECTISSFSIARTETTVWQFALYCAANDRDMSEFLPGWSDSGNNPVVNVSWYDAIAYSNWVSRQHGLPEAYIITTGEKDALNQSAGDDLKWTVVLQANSGYRLPSESEWEYAAGGGGQARTRYAGTSEETQLKNFAWHSENNSGRTRPVGALQANALGLYDMSGNTWEWCFDWYGDYPTKHLRDYFGPEAGEGRVSRGGGWNGYAGYCRVSSRLFDTPVSRSDALGFRLAASLVK